MTIYKFSEEQFETIQSALNAGIGMALRFDTQMILQFNNASTMMDDVANEEGELKPFSTYPEDRAKLLALAEKIETTSSDVEDFTDAADKLADMVKAILSDEAFLIAEIDDELTPEEQSLSEAIGLGVGGRGVAEY